MDRRRFNGGHNTAGRKSTKEKERLIQRLDSVLEIDEVLEHLKRRVLEGDIRAIKLWLEYRYGKPSTTIEMQTTETTPTNFNFKEIVNWN